MGNGFHEDGVRAGLDVARLVNTETGRGMNSCLYLGTLRHRRSRPRVHDFRYRVFMFYLDLDELSDVAGRSGPSRSTGSTWSHSTTVTILDRRPGDTKRKVLRFLRRHGIELPGGKVFGPDELSHPGLRVQSD